MGKWAKLEPTDNSILANRSGIGFGNGYWSGDDNRFEAARQAVEDRTGDSVGNG